VAEPYLIRKYSSRRLYDVAGGRFLTLDDIYRLVREGRRVQAVDSQGRDITRSILLQVLAEREDSEHPLLSAEVLHEMMQLYGHGLQSLFERFMAEGIGALLRQQDLWRHGLQTALSEGAGAALRGLMEQQAQWWGVGGEAASAKATPAAKKRPRGKGRAKRT